MSSFLRRAGRRTGERGATATRMGTYVSKRLPIGGCMITSDPAYSALADVHVPDVLSLKQASHQLSAIPPSGLNTGKRYGMAQTFPAVA